MFTKIKTTEKISESEENLVNTGKLVTISTVRMVNLENFAYEQAGLNKGDDLALATHLSEIQNGHLVNESGDEAENESKRTVLQDQIQAKESEVLIHQTSQRKHEEVLLPEERRKKSEFESAIKTRMTEAKLGLLDSTFSSVRLLLYSFLSLVIGVYLVFFYASSINAAFFRNMLSLISSGGREDIDLLMDSIFDPVGIFQGGPKLLFIYLGAFVFFGLGMIPHALSASNTRFKEIKISAFIILTLLIECLVAYKIDKSLHFIQEQISRDSQPYVWYASTNFYLVLAFGFGAYLLWGYMLELSITEWRKRNPLAMAQMDIKHLKEQIKIADAEISRLKSEVIRLEGEISRLRHEIETLRKRVVLAAQNPEVLLRNYDCFFTGWLRWLTGANISNELREKCRKVFESQKQMTQQLYALNLN